MRIYADESGTHNEEWLVIGMLFVRDHAKLHPALIRVKEDEKYFNASPRHSSARFKETHLADFRSPRDVRVAKRWIDEFLKSQGYFRAIVADCSNFQGKYFGDPFEERSLKKRRAYKKWAEMLLRPELPTFRGASFYLDRLEVLCQYDVLTHLRECFTLDQNGNIRPSPRIALFQAADSWTDENQCLQLADLLTGCVYQTLVPSSNAEKIETTAYLCDQLKLYGVKEMKPGYWKSYAEAQLNRHFPKFSEWFWKSKN
jgi:hypothetical protein